MLTPKQLMIERIETLIEERLESMEGDTDLEEYYEDQGILIGLRQARDVVAECE